MHIANELVSMLPIEDRPETTEGYEGFYHLTSMNGTVEETSLSYIIRDHDFKKFEKRKEMISGFVNELNQKYDNRITLEISDQYYNMREKVEPVKHVIDFAYHAIEAVGVTPKVQPIRGGTDGARLSFMGLPCPNIFAGGLNFHSRNEFLPVNSLKKASEVIVKIVQLVEQESTFSTSFDL